MKRNSVRLFIILYFFLTAASVSAGGKTEDAEQTMLNNEWVLCVTAFGNESLPPARRIIGDVIIRSLVDTLKVVSYRLRISPEYAYYEGYAWNQAVSEAAKKLSAKQDERALLLYRGDPDWKYRQNIKKIDTDIAKLREEFAQKEAAMPLINTEPVFGITQGNRDGSYPAPPKNGAEYRFCRDQKIDAFLAGSIQEYHGRYFVTLKLYTLYTRSFVYEDDIIFSADDTTGAVDEIAGRLTAVLSGNKPAAIAVRAEPREALVLINGSFAGRGGLAARERPPGKVTVVVSADEYQAENVEAELVPGELSEIAMTLIPELKADVNIFAPNASGVSVYRGALYVGEAPLVLRLPLNGLDYISVKGSRGETAQMVFNTPGMPNGSYDFSLKTKIPPPAGQRRVNKARYWYYWAWGGTWITGIAAWVTNGIYTSQNSALSQSSSTDFYDDTQRMYYISTGATILVGVAVAYEIFQMVRYLYTATEDATPIVKRERKKK
jgi:hypothetical protein